MRASRLLRILIILQNRGRQTSQQLAEELECAPRTILRDVDAMSEAGLPILVHQGKGGGIELGFNYRTRLTGLTRQEAEAMALQLSSPHAALDALNIRGVFETARAKFIESLPDKARVICEETADQFVIEAEPPSSADPYLVAVAQAVRERRIITVQARSVAPRTVHPVGLQLGSSGWSLVDALAPTSPIVQSAWGDINISSHRF